MLVSAGMFAAAVHLGRRLPDVNGILVTASGSAVALMYAAYYAVFGAGAVIASGESGPGLGEAAWHALNVMEIARYAPGLALVSAAVVARARLPRAVWGTAAALAVLTIVPMTSWVAALLVPLWLAVSAAAISGRP